MCFCPARRSVVPAPTQPVPESSHAACQWSRNPKLQPVTSHLHPSQSEYNARLQTFTARPWPKVRVPAVPLLPTHEGAAAASHSLLSHTWTTPLWRVPGCVSRPCQSILMRLVPTQCPHLLLEEPASPCRTTRRAAAPVHFCGIPVTPTNFVRCRVTTATSL